MRSKAPSSQLDCPSVLMELVLKTAIATVRTSKALKSQFMDCPIN
ncbi:MAG TPA: hypothetical protein V6D25_09345 [Leptolyngbyaceae cyanobacterium]